MKFLLPTVLLIGVVVILSGAGRRGVRTGRSIFFAVGVMLLLAVIFAYIVQQAT
ncbi:MAG: hypothetical protein ACRDLB_08730 [Actinomycetota bacterium]